MLIAAVAILSALGGVAISIFGQKVEAKYADRNSVDAWNQFVSKAGRK